MDCTPDGENGNDRESEAITREAYSTLVKTFWKRSRVFANTQINTDSLREFWRATDLLANDVASIQENNNYDYLGELQELDSWLRTGQIPYFFEEGTAMEAFWKHLKDLSDENHEFLWRYLKDLLVDNLDRNLYAVDPLLPNNRPKQVKKRKVD